MHKAVLRKTGRFIVHNVTGTRNYYYNKLKEVAKNTDNKTILEIGSGKKVNGEYSYSAKQFFNDSNDFICTDIVPEYGHEILDITTMTNKNKYDIILCLNVLEHVFETKTAIANMHNSLKKGGVIYVAVPVHFPLHDEPHDYWRFTEHSLRRLFDSFEKVEVHHKGSRLFPWGYFLKAAK